MTCQKDLVLAIGEIVVDRPDGDVWLYEVFERLSTDASPHSVTTIRAVLTQELCVSALHPSGTGGKLVERLGRGRYRVLSGRHVPAGNH